MKKIHVSLMRDVGVRFTLFRKAIKKSRIQLEKELEAPEKTIEKIERGGGYPEINYLHYLNRNYGLNINWIFDGQKEMFLEKRPADLDRNYVIGPPVSPKDPKFEIYSEFLRLMQVPAIEKAIMQYLEEIIDRIRETP